MEHTDIINKTIDFVKETLKDAEGGHDWHHIERVYNNAKNIAETEDADILVVELAALLHDIADPKFNNGDEEKGPALAAEFLTSIGIDPVVIAHVQNIIRYMSFKSSFDEPKFTSIEMQIVQDADRLDAMGAIGIARAFNYGGHKGRAIYDPAIKPEIHANKEAYKNSTAPTINHFYEKLLLLKDKMNTETGMRLAQQRHNFMLVYLDQFYKEVK
nr:HD domain-containing protein [uncultured Mucilaginibacter sp.]